jgi:hypothetical protein
MSASDVAPAGPGVSMFAGASAGVGYAGSTWNLENSEWRFDERSASCWVVTTDR